MASPRLSYRVQASQPTASAIGTGGTGNGMRRRAAAWWSRSCPPNAELRPGMQGIAGEKVLADQASWRMLRSLCGRGSGEIPGSSWAVKTGRAVRGGEEGSANILIYRSPAPSTVAVLLAAPP